MQESSEVTKRPRWILIYDAQLIDVQIGLVPNAPSAWRGMPDQ